MEEKVRKDIHMGEKKSGHRYKKSIYGRIQKNGEGFITKQLPL
jgi:hypothetical protein